MEKINLREIDLIDDGPLGPAIDRRPEHLVAAEAGDLVEAGSYDKKTNMGDRPENYRFYRDGDDENVNDGADAGGLMADVSGAFSGMSHTYGGALVGGMTGYMLAGSAGALVGAIMGAQLTNQRYG